jgi:hypothetical protein
MPHMTTDGGRDLELKRGDDGTITLRLYTDDVETGPEAGPRFYSITAVLSAGEARMIGAYLNPSTSSGPPATTVPPPAPAPRAPRYDPSSGTMPADWRELVVYARHMAARGLEVAITVPVPVPELDELTRPAPWDVDLDGDGDGPDVTVTIDPTVTPPGKFTVGRNGQRIATYHLGRNAAQGR